TFVSRSVGSARVGAALRETAGPIGMHQPERLDCERMAHDRTDQSVAAILLVSKAVTVLQSYLPAGDRALPRAIHIRDADIFAKYFSAPGIVIASDPENLDAGVLELSERSEGAKAPSRDHRLPLEPEVEQVAVDHERSRLTCKPPQEGDKRALGLRARNSKMSVRHDVARAVEHGTS
ncbi:MAG: hypothetical protein QOH22_164, partial [Gemmatimonadaceae bacterium]|nr:hypothetical protein [Gemmatimonadaceae bacterium]